MHGEASDPQRFQDRTVLITGAAGGLGSAAAPFCRRGRQAALLDRDGAAVAELAEQLVAQGHVALALEVDVADERSLAAAIAAAEEHFGQIDVLFNNAGVGSRDLSLVDTPADHWDEVLAINLRGVFLGCKYGVPALIRAGGGAIVNMGSSTGRHDTITVAPPTWPARRQSRRSPNRWRCKSLRMASGPIPSVPASSRRD